MHIAPFCIVFVIKVVGRLKQFYVAEHFISPFSSFHTQYIVQLRTSVILSQTEGKPKMSDLETPEHTAKRSRKSKNGLNMKRPLRGKQDFFQ